MQVKKKILRQCFDGNSQKEYEKQAKICPNCGYEGDNGDPPKRLPTPKPIKWNEFKVVYECCKCGCQWRVKRYVKF